MRLPTDESADPERLFGDTSLRAVPRVEGRHISATQVRSFTRLPTGDPAPSLVTVTVQTYYGAYKRYFPIQLLRVNQLSLQALQSLDYQKSGKKCLEFREEY